MKTIENTNYEKQVKEYNEIIKNARSTRNYLRKSWLWIDIFDSMNYIIDNYKLSDHLEKWLYRYCNDNHLKFDCPMWYIYPVTKINSFSDYYLKRIKENYDKWIKDKYTSYWKYDYSITIDPENKKAWYSKEYQCCANWSYYLMIDYNHAMLYEND